jgi:hypothetical protein
VEGPEMSNQRVVSQYYASILVDPAKKMLYDNPLSVLFAMCLFPPSATSGHHIETFDQFIARTISVCFVTIQLFFTKVNVYAFRKHVLQGLAVGFVSRVKKEV